MKQVVVIALLIALTFSTCILPCYSVTVHNIGIDFQPTDELEYVNLLKIMLGRHDEATTLSPSLAELVKNNRNSLSHSYDRAMLAFMPFPSEEDVHHF